MHHSVRNVFFETTDAISSLVEGKKIDDKQKALIGQLIEDRKKHFFCCACKEMAMIVDDDCSNCGTPIQLASELPLE